MLFKHFCLYMLIFTFTWAGCNNKSFGMFDDANVIYLNRFDSALFQWINTDDPVILQTVMTDYPQMLAMLGNSLFDTNLTDSSAFFSQMINYYSEPTLKSLYNDAIRLYDTNSPATKQIEMELSHGFMQLKKMMPSIQIPAVYMHVSGLQQNIIVADSLLSFSIDKYLGADYPFYQDFFYDYQLKSMTPQNVAKDGLYAWLSSEYPSLGQPNDLLERMIYEGKIIYLLKQCGYKYSYQQILSLTEQEYKWCLKKESAIWKLILEQKHLETSYQVTVSRYFQSAPSLFIAEEAPGNLGAFIGYRIVEQYMKQTKSTFEELIHNNDAQDIFIKSKYKP